MKTYLPSTSRSTRQFTGRCLGFVIVAVFTIVGSACTTGTIQPSGGTSGTNAGGAGKGGVGGGGGHGGTGVVVDTTVKATGGTGAGSSLVCNSTDISSGCIQQIPEGCGDGINNQGGIEECDDGNAKPGDGCNGVCKVEKNWTCPKQGKCTRNIICGDGNVGAGEVCDDGNTKDNDGCNSTCTVQDPRYKCVAGQPCVLTSQCGNKRIESGENCDDGNAKAGDGCSATCQLEAGYVCPTPGAACKKAPRCGDGVVQ